MDPSAEPTPPSIDTALNLKQVARALDVHYMTAYRYVRHGSLRARRDGTMWLVDEADLEEFRARAASPEADASRSVDWAARLVGRLCEGDEVGSWTVLRDALAAGHGFESVHLEVLAGALRTVGVEVADGRRTAAEERVVVSTAWRLVARLGGQFPHRGRKRGEVVLASPPGEHHGLPLALVANLLRHVGLRVVELGTDTPAPHVLAAIDRSHDLVALGIGVTTVERLPAARALIATVRAVHPSLPVLLGGQAVRNPEIAELAGATAWSAGPDLVAQIDRLLAGPRVPDRT